VTKHLKSCHPQSQGAHGVMVVTRNDNDLMGKQIIIYYIYIGGFKLSFQRHFRHIFHESLVMACLAYDRKKVAKSPSVIRVTE
jgi:hypothetical protein